MQSTKSTSDEPSLFFLTGLPKSGTTWLMKMLNDVEDIRCLGEGRFFSSGLRDVPSLHKCLAEGMRPWYEFIALRKNNWLACDADLETVNRQNFLSEKLLESRFQQDVARAMRLLLTEFMTRGQKDEKPPRLIGDKTPVLRVEEISHMLAAFPSAKIVFLQRNVKDFIVSLLCHFHRSMRDNRPDCRMEGLTVQDFLQVDAFLSEKGEDKPTFISQDTALRLAEIWQKVNQYAAQLVRERPNEFLLISYERLRSNPLPEVQKVFSFLGVSIGAENLQKIVDRHDQKAVMLGADKALKDHIRSGEEGDWVNYLNKELCDAIDLLVKNT